MKMRIARIFSFVLSLSFALVITGTLLTTSGGTAFAKKASSPHITKVTFPMSTVRTATPHSVTPKDFVPGPCGNITLWLFQSGPGNVQFFKAVSSSQGAIITLTYTVTWVNHSRGFSNSFGNTLLLPSNPWTDRNVLHTQSGFITGVMVVNDHVGAPWPFGKSCTGVANDFQQVS